MPESVDPTETFRRARVNEIASEATDRTGLEARYGQVWNTEEVGRDFEILSFMAPFVVARRRSDNQKGTLEFQHSPRFYFDWKEDKP